jgi:hypothetical protein
LFSFNTAIHVHIEYGVGRFGAVQTEINGRRRKSSKSLQRRDILFVSSITCTAFQIQRKRRAEPPTTDLDALPGTPSRNEPKRKSKTLPGN